ncbi:MAG: hypothetical protein AAGG48_05475 [Planctomycetota bacterium]
MTRILSTVTLLLLLALIMPSAAHGQAFGVMLQNNLMPASGGMGGVSIARPQDIQSALGGNPATLAQQKGTKFSFSGAWVEPTINMDHDTTIAAASITPFESRSRRPGSIVGNIGVTQDLSALGIPGTVGMGLLTASGLGVNYRDVVASNGTSAELVALATGVGAGVDLTDRLSVGLTAVVGSTSMDGIFSGTSGATPDYNLRALLGFTYDINDSTSIGGYWHTEQKHTFDDFLRVGGAGNPFIDVSLSFPSVYGLGVANQSLMNGRLLIGIDVLYFEWSETDFFGAIWDDQLAVQSGIQFTTPSGVKFRLGHVYARDASRNVVAPDIGGVINPQSTVDYIQSLFPNINEHRLTGGIGIKDILPGVDFDLFAGGQFEDTRDFGDTSVSIESYWIGFGTTWRFSRGGCCVDAPSRW